jgi:hypothetical protein
MPSRTFEPREFNVMDVSTKGQLFGADDDNSAIDSETDEQSTEPTADMLVDADRGPGLGDCPSGLAFNRPPPWRWPEV